jgi:hypothetical protein
VKRTDQIKPIMKFVKLSVFYDIVDSKFLALKIRKKPMIQKDL